MKIFGMGTTELLVILGIALLIFGPKNLPKLGNALGKTVKNLRDGMSGVKEDLNDFGEEGNTVETASEEDATEAK
ncbi:MAG: twin-arginine translocase TatA/TatE family subunit [Eggerthellaceae bacterium]|nr:twin-arginine translocase TatA/TatE family subunit [Eggerthellaceae bacterium]